MFLYRYNTTGACLSLNSTEKYMPTALQKVPKNNSAEAGGHPMHLWSWS